MNQDPVINCHTHIFTGDHVPPYLAKTIVPSPFYYLINLHWLVRFFRAYHKQKARILYHPLYIRFKGLKNRIQSFTGKLGFFKMIIAVVITLESIFILYRYLATYIPSTSGLKYFQKIYSWFVNHHLIISTKNHWLEIVFIACLLLFIPSGRNFIFFVLKKIWSFLGVFSNKQTKELMARYMNIGRYAFHQGQSTIFSKLKAQYPQGTRFVLLPMDMGYMEAGKVNVSYHEQMKELADIKMRNPEVALPFVFAEPRRMAEEPTHFLYTMTNGYMELEKCFIKDYIEEYQFSGFKIYPALGYYPFDEQLLPLWKYAADKGIPIITHCIRGTIYFRGKKKDEWNHHPVFEQTNGKKTYSPLLLDDMDPMNYSCNFTHPLNYLCLLEEKLLRKLVARSGDRVQNLFGYENDETPLKHNLAHLKICFGHFGGDDEWKRFFERDRDNYSSQLLKQPNLGVDFLHDQNGNEARGKLEICWKSVDWYTIICSLILQYQNVYADISYILHDETATLPLLKQTLSQSKLRERVLFGTDFFVVRNHKSDRQMLADMSYGLSDKDFDQIARINPQQFLNLTVA